MARVAKLLARVEAPHFIGQDWHMYLIYVSYITSHGQLADSAQRLCSRLASIFIGAGGYQRFETDLSRPQKEDYRIKPDHTDLIRKQVTLSPLKSKSRAV
jgi:hypothetical protein